MYVLEQQEIEKITDRITLARVENNSLSIDLVDHICCMVEERVELGMKLNQAEDEVFREMGEVQLKAIEIETKKLTQNKFIMKKRTKIIGFIALVLVLLGFTMKMFHLQGAGITWGVGILFMAFGFFLMLFIDRFSYEKSNYYRITQVIGYLGAASLIVGLGFVLLRWPIAVFLVEGGGILLLIYFILNNTKISHATDPQ
ncbi:MAG: hypothetical protein ABFS32_08555 [Bacteroidota bacterium]